MSDRELLEKAARAAGLPWDQWVAHGNDWWNPLTDDGDALRLAVRLRIHLFLYGNTAQAKAGPDHPVHTEVAPEGADPCTATRRAIVRAAAALASSTDTAGQEVQR